MSEHDHAHDHDHPHDHDHGHDHGDEVTPTEREQLVHDLRKQVALSQVRQYGDPALRMRAEEVVTFDDDLARLAERMTSLMHDAEGIGLAANQIGVVRRLFVFHADDEDHALVNPRIVTAGSETEIDEEGCLSLGPVRVPVERPIAVTIEGQDLAGEPVRFELEGLPARVVQHELDHLDGTLTVDRTDADSRREALRQLRPRLLLR